MKSFVGLLKKEWVLYRARLLVGVFIGIVLSLVVPYFLRHFADGFEQDSQLSYTVLVLIIGGFYSVLQFLSSIRADLKVKEIWLHSTSAMTTLIGAKMVSSIIGYTLFNLLFTSIAVYSIKDEYIANFGQIIFLVILIIGIIAILQLVLYIMLVLFLAFYLQMKHFIGGFSIVLTMAAFFLTTNQWLRFTTSQLYQDIFRQIGIPLSKMEPYLPKFISPTMELKLGSIYVVEQVGFMLLMTLLYIVAAKWLEKVVLR